MDILLILGGLALIAMHVLVLSIQHIGSLFAPPRRYRRRDW